MNNLSNQEQNIVFVNAQGDNQDTDDQNTLYRNRMYEAYQTTDNAHFEFMKEIFTCIITQKLFLEPVITPEGHTYEKEAIKAWIKKFKTDPRTRNSLNEGSLRKNNAIESLTTTFINDNSLQSEGRGRADVTDETLVNKFKATLLKTVSTRKGMAATALLIASSSTTVASSLSAGAATSISTGNNMPNEADGSNNIARNVVGTTPYGTAQQRTTSSLSGLKCIILFGTAAAGLATLLITTRATADTCTNESSTSWSGLFFRR